MVQSIIDDVLSRPRVLEHKKRDLEPPPFPVLWVQTFNTAAEQINDVVKRANTVIQLSPAWKNEKRALGVVNRRGKTLGDMVLKRKLFALKDDSTNTGTTRCTPVTLPGQKKKRGRPCESCNLMSNRKSIKSTANGNSFRTPKGNCRSQKLIYGAECLICKKQYTGQTVNKLQTRICGHRTHINKTTSTDQNEDSDEAALANHLKEAHNFHTAELFNLCYSFTILQLDPGDLDKAEQKWIQQLTTMTPYGLNIEKPRGVSDSLMAMSQKCSNSQRR